MIIKEKIEMLREELEFAISVANENGLTMDEIIQISKKLDEEISRYYEEVDKKTETDD